MVAHPAGRYSVWDAASDVIVATLLIREVIVSPDTTKQTRQITLIRSLSEPGEAQKFDACLLGLAGRDMGRRFLLAQRKVTLGRSDQADVTIDDDDASRIHCEILSLPVGVMLNDLASTNGTFVNGKRVERHLLSDGDQLQIGRSVFRFTRANHVEAHYFDEMFRLTNTDPLTGVYNKRYFLSMLERELARAERHQRQTALLMLDLDFFKKVNDTYGHVAGDAVLVEAAKRIGAILTSEDLLARFGGEEFVALLDETTLEEAAVIAERIRASIAATPVEHAGASIAITTSIGVSGLQEIAGSDDAASRTQRVEALLTLADTKLYEAKHAGRNRVVI
jgi:diguanylate cyclase (GGDEF)-like protein